MSHALSNNTWRPTTSLAALQSRAALLADCRAFFAARDILEVETPLLSQYTVTDPHIASLKTTLNYYLQTSPEYAMKRLLSAGSGSIYQICKAFRNDECSRKHNPEFTMLEWYRVGFNDRLLMQEVSDFLQYCIDTPPARIISYQHLFLQYLQIDPYHCAFIDLRDLAQQSGLHLSSHDTVMTYDDLLQFLFGSVIEPQLGFDAPVIVHDFPPSQAALAKIRLESMPVAERFEVYIQGIELANGFHELTDAAEQQQRFLDNQVRRKQLDYPDMAIDHRFIAALEAGMPDCAGVAVGIDRLLMIKNRTNNIRDVISFPWEIA